MIKEDYESPPFLFNLKLSGYETNHINYLIYYWSSPSLCPKESDISSKRFHSGNRINEEWFKSSSFIKLRCLQPANEIQKKG